MFSLLVATTNLARAEFRWASTYLSLLGGYDTNVKRIPAGMPGQDIEGDGRAVFLGSVSGEYESQEKLRVAFEGRPYYVAYFNLNEYDRAELFGAGELEYAWSEHWKLEVRDRFRYTNFTGRDFDRVYNSIEPGLVYRGSHRWNASAQYRYMYREAPRRIFEWWQAHGITGTLSVNALDRLTLKALGRVDLQSEQFVFPRQVSGQRYTADVSGRYFLGSNTLLMAKYLFQDDSMDIVFAPGIDIDRLGDPADDFSDGILQSLRFLEDTDNNYRKHLLVVLSHTSIGGEAFLEAFLLFQRKRFVQGVVSLPDRPRRLDDTYIAQAVLQLPLGGHASAVGSLRYETTRSNDARAEYRYTIVGAGLKWVF